MKRLFIESPRIYLIPSFPVVPIYKRSKINYWEISVSVSLKSSSVTTTAA